MSVAVLPILVALAAGQLLLALVLAVSFGGFYRAFRRSYLRHWGLSWLGLAVFIAASSVSGRTTGEATSDWRGLVLTLAVVAGYLHIAWLLLGVIELARDSRLRQGWVLGASASAVVAGLVSAGPALIGIPTPWVLGGRSLVAGAAYVAAAVLLLPRLGRPGMGRLFSGFALLLYAADQFAYATLGLYTRARQTSTVPLVMSFDLVATAVIGLALVTWLLEGERERLRRASEIERRRERAQAGIYGISGATRRLASLPELFSSIHAILHDVLPARNFYVALVDRAAGRLSFPYFADEKDEAPEPRPLGRGLTEYVLRTGRPLLATPAVFEDLRLRGGDTSAPTGRRASSRSPTGPSN